MCSVVRLVAMRVTCHVWPVTRNLLDCGLCSHMGAAVEVCIKTRSECMLQHTHTHTHTHNC
jgi:hypothetical protein